MPLPLLRLTARQIRELLYPNSTKPQHGTVQRFLQTVRLRMLQRFGGALIQHKQRRHTVPEKPSEILQKYFKNDPESLPR